VKRILLVSYLLFQGTCVNAGDLAQLRSIPIPGQGWKITFSAPPWKHRWESKSGGDYQFKGNCDRFNLSLFVEAPRRADGVHKDCFEFYWPQSAKNPLIDKESVKVSHTDAFYRVAYLTKSEGAGGKQGNVNYYFVFAGRWVDLHISIVSPNQEDAEFIKRFDESLAYKKSSD